MAAFLASPGAESGDGQRAHGVLTTLCSQPKVMQNRAGTTALGTLPKEHGPIESSQDPTLSSSNRSRTLTGELSQDALCFPLDAPSRGFAACRAFIISSSVAPAA